MIAKNADPKEFTIGNYRFYIHPFGAFKAANLTGDLAALFIPLIGTLAPLLGKEEEEGSLLDIEVDAAVPVMTRTFSTFNGDQVESLLKKLLVKNRNIAVEEIDNKEDEPEWLTADIANSLFCGDVHEMYILAYHVIQTNYSGFFGRLAGLSGKDLKKSAEKILEKMK